MPDCVVWRIWWSGPEGFDVSTPLGSISAGKSEELGMWRWDWRRCVVTGKWPVWNVDLWRRRRPPIDLGSIRKLDIGKEGFVS